MTDALLFPMAAAVTSCPKTEAIEACLRAHFAALDRLDLPFDGTLYSIEEQFGTLCDSWKCDLHNGTGRFGRTRESIVLYRSHIAEELFEKVEQVLTIPGIGILLKGPPGIGKSYSLVNLVLKLQSTGKYFVTFFPDCGRVRSSDSFLKVICDSFGIDVFVARGIDSFCPTGYRAVQVHELEETIDSIAKCLRTMNKQWVCIFDQINSLFDRNYDDRRISYLDVPFNFIQHVMRSGVISITTASVNGEVSFLHRQECFADFDHSTEMSDEELTTVFGGEFANFDLKTVKEIAGSVPLYVKKLLADGDVTFRDSLKSEMSVSCQRLQMNEFRWRDQLKSIISCVLAVKLGILPAICYDRKYLLCTRLDRGEYLFKPLFPAVVQIYRSLLWHEIIAFVHSKGLNLLDMCGPTSDLAGRLTVFEYLVIQRLTSGGLKFCWLQSLITVNAGQRHFFGSKLPHLPQSDGIWIPDNLSFPAIDFFVKYGRIAIGFAVHVGSPMDVSKAFFDLCEEAGWFDAISEIGLIYLGPSTAATKMAKNLVEPAFYHRVALDFDEISISARVKRRRGKGIRRLALATTEIDVLKTISWSY
jgi:hypothetical protein